MIRISNLTFGYGHEPLFDRLTMTLKPGNIYGLLGLNGAGKSSLLNLMSGLLFPNGGDLTALGHEPRQREPSYLADVFMLPEELNVPGVRGSQYAGTLAPFYPAFDHDRLVYYLSEFDLDIESRLTGLSYGQKKKFLLSFGLASNTKLLLLDEPTNGLDIPSKGLFRRLVAEAVSEQRTIVISTHQVRDVDSLIDPIVILHRGSVLFQQTMADIAATIRMSHSVSRPAADSPGLLYCEQAVGGYWSIWSDGAQEGLIDVEVLFNAVVSNPAIYASSFGEQGDKS